MKWLLLPVFLAISGIRHVYGSEESDSKTDDVAFSCPQKSGYFAHPVQCNKYYQCLRNESTLVTCGEGLLFDDTTAQCEVATTVDCGERAVPKEYKLDKDSLTCQTGKYHFPRPNDKSLFLQCQMCKCPKGLVFDLSLKVCYLPQEPHDCPSSNHDEN